jgi:Leucine-rich repeat (LRR) protein
LAELVPAVQHLQLVGNQAEGGITDDQLAELAGLENLEEIEIVQSPITDVGLQHLAKLKRLKRLFLWVCPELNGSDLAPIADLKTLREFDWMEPVSAGGLASIAGLDRLEKLRLNVAELQPGDVLPLAHLRHLHTLSLTYRDQNGEPIEIAADELIEKVSLGDAIARALGKMPALRILSLEMPLSNKGLALLTAPGKLQAVRLLLHEVNDRSLALVSELPRLRQLRLRGTAKLSDEAVAPLAKLTALVDLSLPATDLTDAGLAQLAPLTRLEYLNLPDSQITGSGLAALGCKSLKQLNLSGSSFDDVGCRNLPQFAALEMLCLFDTKLTDAGLQSIAELPKLEKLYVYDTTISDAGIVKLGSRAKLREVYAMGTTVSQKGVDRLHAAASGIWVIFDPAPPAPDEDDHVYFSAE